MSSIRSCDEWWRCLVRCLALTPAPTDARDCEIVRLGPEGGLRPAGLPAYYEHLSRSSPASREAIPRGTLSADRGDAVAGCRDMPAAFRHILARGWVRLAFKAATQLWRPTVWRKVASLALYPIRSRSGERNSDGRTEGSPPEPVEAELLAIAVAASARGGGVGRRLVRLE